MPWSMIGRRSEQPTASLTPEALTAALESGDGGGILKEMQKLSDSSLEVWADVLLRCAVSPYFRGNPDLRIVNGIAELARERLGIDVIRNGAKEYAMVARAGMIEIGDGFDLNKIRDTLFPEGDGYYCFLRALSWAAGLTG